MPDQIDFNDSLGLLDGTPLATNLTGSVVIDYTTNTIVAGSLNLSAAGTLGAQAYTLADLGITRTGTTIAGLPIYQLTGSNGATNLAIDYTGELPTSITANVQDSLLQTNLASGAGAVNAAIVCFLAGTLIRTGRGDVPVETLRIGEAVLTSAGTSRRITWVGSRKLDCRRYAEPRAVRPVRIAADAFGDGLPFQDLFVSPGHALCVRVLDEILVPATALVNGTTVTQIEAEEVIYWHVELDAHDIIFANGLPTESYINVGNRTFFEDGRGEVDPMRTPAVLADYCRPYVASGLCIRALRERLQDRARMLGWHLESATLADLHLCVDGKRVEPEIDGLTVRFRFSADASEVWLACETAIASHLFDTPDARHLGVCLRTLSIGDRVQTRTIDLADPLLCAGFHAVETIGEASQRWTAGRGRLPSNLWRGLSDELLLEVELAAPALPRWRPPADTGPRRPVLVKDAA